MGTVLISKSGASTKLNHRAVLGFDSHVVSHCSCLYPKNPNNLLWEYLYYASLSIDVNEALKNVKVLLPALEEQELIVKEWEAEQEIIDTNKKLIENLQKHMRDKIDSIWVLG